MPNFRDYDQSQTVFRQLVPAQLLEEDHPARIVNAVVEMLDLDQVYAWYKEEGKPAYHPQGRIALRHGMTGGHSLPP